MGTTASNIDEDLRGNKNLDHSSSHRNGSEYIRTWIASRLKSLGFDVHTNYPIAGEGHISHVFDIIAEFSPLPNTIFRMGFILLKNNIDIDVIEKYIAWKSELPLDKIIIVALGNIEPEAFELAKRYNIDIIRPVEDLNLNKGILKEGKLYDEYHIEPVVGTKDALKIFKSKSSKTSILRRNKSKLLYYSLVFAPLVVLDIHLAEKNIVKEEVSIVEEKLVFDGLEGYAIVKEGFSIGIDEVLGKFSDLSSEALAVLKRVTREGTVPIADIEESLNIPSEKLRTIFGRLSNKSLLDIFGDIVEIRYSLLSRFADPFSIAKTKNAEIHRGIPMEARGRIVLPLKVCITRFIDLVEALDGRVEKIYVIYYPFYIGVKSENGDKTSKLIILDAITLEEKNSFYKIFSHLEVLERIKEKGLRAQS